MGLLSKLRSQGYAPWRRLYTLFIVDWCSGLFKFPETIMCLSSQCLPVSFNSVPGWCSWAAGPFFLLPQVCHERRCWLICILWASAIPLKPPGAAVTLAFQHVVTCPLLPLEVPNPITTQSWSAVTGQHCLPECEINGTEEINSRVNSISWSIHSMQAVLELSLVEDKSVCIESTVMIHYMIYYMIQWFISICSTF